MLSLVCIVWIDGRVVEGGALLRHCMKACAACRGFESLSIRFVVWGCVMEDCSPVVEFRIHNAACGVESATVSCRMPMKRVDLTGSGEGYVPDSGRFNIAFENACRAFKREFERV